MSQYADDIKLCEAFDHGHRDASTRIAGWIALNAGTFGPDVPCSGMACLHGWYDWESCENCVIDQIIEGIKDASYLNE